MPFSCAASSASAICPGDGQRFLERDSARPVSGYPDAGGQGRTFHQLHDEIIRPDVVERADVRMIQRGDGACLALEAVAKLGTGNLDRDQAIQGVSRAL